MDLWEAAGGWSPHTCVLSVPGPSAATAEQGCDEAISCDGGRDEKPANSAVISEGVGLPRTLTRKFPISWWLSNFRGNLNFSSVLSASLRGQSAAYFWFSMSFIIFISLLALCKQFQTFFLPCLTTYEIEIILQVWQTGYFQIDVSQKSCSKNNQRPLKQDFLWWIRALIYSIYGVRRTKHQPPCLTDTGLWNRKFWNWDIRQTKDRSLINKLCAWKSWN